MYVRGYLQGNENGRVVTIEASCRSFIRIIVPYEISKVNFRVETKILVSMSEEN